MAYQHDAASFYGLPDRQPLAVPLHGRTARYVRAAVAGQGSASIWTKWRSTHRRESQRGPGPAGHAEQHQRLVGGAPACAVPAGSRRRRRAVKPGVAAGRRSSPPRRYRRRPGIQPPRRIGRRARHLAASAPEDIWQRLYLDACWCGAAAGLRQSAVGFRRDPVRQVGARPVSPHVGPVLRLVVAAGRAACSSWRASNARCKTVRPLPVPRSRSRSCVSDVRHARGEFYASRPSYDGRKVLFAYCRYYPDVAGH